MSELVFPTQKQWSTLRELGLTEHSHNKVIIRPDVQAKLLASGYAPDNLPEQLPEGYVVGEDPDVSFEVISSTEDLLINHLDLQ